jgi:hypothetical protein
MSAIRRFVNLTTQKPKICGAMVPPLNISDSALQAVSLYASHFRSVSLRFDAFSVASPSRFKADWYVSFNLESTVFCTLTRQIFVSAVEQQHFVSSSWALADSATRIAMPIRAFRNVKQIMRLSFHSQDEEAPGTRERVRIYHNPAPFAVLPLRDLAEDLPVAELLAFNANCWAAYVPLHLALFLAVISC